MKTPLAVLCTAGAITAIAAPALGSGPTVRVSEYKFTAKNVHIKRGATVKWTWPAAGGDPHNVTFSGFHSKTQPKGSFSHTFSKPGTYKYVCTIHNKKFGMHGTVVVS